MAQVLLLKPLSDRPSCFIPQALSFTDGATIPVDSLAYPGKRFKFVIAVRCLILVVGFCQSAVLPIPTVISVPKVVAVACGDEFTLLLTSTLLCFCGNEPETLCRRLQGVCFRPK